MKVKDKISGDIFIVYGAREEEHEYKDYTGIFRESETELLIYFSGWSWVDADRFEPYEEEKQENKNICYEKNVIVTMEDFLGKDSICNVDFFRCVNCRTYVMKKDNYCWKCGVKLEWQLDKKVNNLLD